MVKSTSGGSIVTEAPDTVRPEQAGVPPRTFPAKRVQKNRRGKKQPCYARSTTKTGQSWRSTIDENGATLPVRCPQCGAIIVFDHRSFPSCGQCSHSFTRAEREELDARDPELIPARRYMSRWDTKIMRMSGKERREKRFLSKCARGGC